MSLLGNKLRSDSVHIGGTFFGEGFTVDGNVSVLVLVGHASNQLSVLELNKAVSDAFSSDESGVLLLDTISLLGRVVLSEGVDTNLSSHVELVCDGGSSDVKPVWVIRSQVLLACSLVVDSPL